MFALLRSFFGAAAPASALDDIRRMSSNEFEYLVGEGFRRRGYSQGAPPTDGCVDLIIRKLDDTFFVHYGRWKAGSVGAKPVRALADAVAAGHAAGGFFIATGTLSAEAREIARRTHIELIDGRELELLIVDARRPEPFMDPTESRRRTSFRK
jgi:restriction system protein